MLAISVQAGGLVNVNEGAWVALVGAVTAMALLAFAPTTQVRKERYGEPAGLVELVVLLYQFTKQDGKENPLH